MEGQVGFTAHQQRGLRRKGPWLFPAVPEGEGTQSCCPARTHLSPSGPERHLPHFTAPAVTTLLVPAAHAWPARELEQEVPQRKQNEVWENLLVSSLSGLGKWASVLCRESLVPALLETR